MIDNFATLGGLSAIHQFVHIGDHAFLGGGAMVANDIPPFCMAQGDRAKLVGLNSVGLTRHEFSADDVELLKRVYRTLFVSSGLSSERLQRAGEIAGEHPAALRLLEFVRSSERGVAKARMSQRGLEDGESNSDAD